MSNQRRDSLSRTQVLSAFEDLNIDSLRRQNREALIQPLLVGFGVIILTSMLMGIIFIIVTGAPLTRSSVIQISAAAIISSILIILGRTQDRVPYALRAVILTLCILVLVPNDLNNYGLLGQARLSLLVSIFLTAVLFRSRAGLLVMAISIGTLAFAGIRVFIGNVPADLASILAGETAVALTIQFTLIASLMMSIIILVLRNAARILDRQRTLAQTVTEERTQLEQRVQSRTRSLTLTAEINQIISTILNRDQLIAEVIDQIQQTFGYYHVHFYILNQEEEALTLATGTGEAGTAMRLNRHQIAVNKGLIGRAAQSNQVQIVEDVSQNPVWIANPLLPKTRSEIAIPIVVQHDVFGVLDIQNDVVNGFRADEIEAIELIAAQLGIALQNAATYNRVQQRIILEQTISNLSQQIALASDVESVLQVAIRETGLALRATRTNVSIDPVALQQALARVGGNS